MKYLTITLTLLLLFMMNTFGQKPTKTVTFNSLDNLKITADIYEIDPDAPYIILFHQARYSRGEYLEIAPKLNALGFNCLAVDQRSGDVVKDVINETQQRAEKKGLATKYTDAWPDLEAAFRYTKKNLKAKKIIVWGSSYSAALVFVLGSKYAEDVKGILAFSPGDYFTIKDKAISEYAKTVTAPVFITSSKSEEPYWRPIYDNLPTSTKTFYLPMDEGFHGSKALWEENEGYENYWEAVKEFLDQYK